MIAWGMTQDGDGALAVVRKDNAALTVRDINRSSGLSFPLSLDALIAGGLTASLVALAERHDWFRQRGREVASLAMTLPLTAPERIVGIGLNFPTHAHDLGAPVPGEPATFVKTTNTLALSGSPVVLPAGVGRVTAEGEMALIFGGRARNVPAREAPAVIWGAAAVIDLTAEDVLKKNPRFLTRAKGYDGFLVMSPWLVPWDAPDWDRVRRIDTINQRSGSQTTGTTEQMTFDCRSLVEWITAGVSVAPTALLSTGTPGAVVVEPGDQVSVRIDGLYGVEMSVE